LDKLFVRRPPGRSGSLGRRSFDLGRDGVGGQLPACPQGDKNRSDRVAARGVNSAGREAGSIDDSSPGQFRYLIRNGKKEIDPDCAVGILLDFKRRHPDFGAKATFFVLPGADEPNKLFGQPEFESEKLAKLVELGFEIGNHTLWHANLKKYEAGTVRKQLALAVQSIQSAVPGYSVQALALPFGMYPKDLSWAVEGSYGNTSYHNRVILQVSGGPALSPFNSQWDPLHLPRIQATGNNLERLIHYYEKHPDEMFISDGRSDNVMFPVGLKSEFAPSRFKSVYACTY
jgi:hypothetical protein